MASARKKSQEERLRAFEVVVSEYEIRLLRYTTRVLHNANAAQDVVQESQLGDDLYYLGLDKHRPSSRAQRQMLLDALESFSKTHGPIKQMTSNADSSGRITGFYLWLDK